MTTRRSLLLLTPAILLSLATASAAEPSAFTPEAFLSAQQAGKAILVDVTAPWCPTCKAQAPIIKDLTSRDVYKNVVVFHVDFDNQKDVVRSFNARSQSTLISFRGQEEVARSVGVTDPAAIEEMLAKAVSGS
jgi:thiol-disulfide isomerase/thioredoxin